MKSNRRQLKLIFGFYMLYISEDMNIGSKYIYIYKQVMYMYVYVWKYNSENYLFI